MFIPAPTDKGSGKHWSEIHALLQENIRHQKDWSKVSLYQRGSRKCGPVVITALAPSLDKSLKTGLCLLQERMQQIYICCVYLIMDEADCDPML